MNQKETLKELKHGLARKLGLGERCYVCHRTKYRGGMVLHHLWYVLGEKISRHFKPSMKGRIDYHEYLNYIFEKEGRILGFKYLCVACHNEISRIRRIKDNDRISRLFEVVFETKYYSKDAMKRIFEMGLEK